MGNKSKIAQEIHQHFPPHEIYIEMFFGAGGMFFNKPRAKQNFLNDIDDDIFNLFLVAEKRKQELIEAIERMPVSESLFKYWKENKETEPIQKALRFLFLSNFSYLGAAHTFVSSCLHNAKRVLIQNITHYKPPKDTYFLCTDFREVVGKIGDIKNQNHKAFIYADPPYIGTNGNYDAFNEDEMADLFRVLVESGIRFAISEFNHPFVMKQAGNYGLHIIEIRERQNVNNRRTEYLITNYQPAKRQLSILDHLYQ